MRYSSYSSFNIVVRGVLCMYRTWYIAYARRVRLFCAVAKPIPHLIQVCCPLNVGSILQGSSLRRQNTHVPLVYRSMNFLGCERTSMPLKLDFRLKRYQALISWFLRVSKALTTVTLQHQGAVLYVSKHFSADLPASGAVKNGVPFSG